MPQESRPTEKFRTSVGGQALMEGIMMRGPKKICCAVRRPDGTIDLTYEDVHTHWYNKIPLLRGVCNMVENLCSGYKYLMHSADIAMTEEEQEAEQSRFDKWLEEHTGPAFQNVLMTVSALLGVVLMVCEVGYPLGCWIGGRLRPRRLGWLYAVCTAGCGLCTLAMGAAPLAGAVAGGAGFAMFGTIWSLHARKRLNDWFPSERRATLISVDSMAYSLLMIPASPLTGWIGDVAGSAGAGLMALGAVLLAAACMAVLRALKNQNT